MVFKGPENEKNIQDIFDGGGLYGDYNESHFPDDSNLEAVEQLPAVDDVLQSHGALVELINEVLDMAELDRSQRIAIRRKIAREIDVVSRFRSRRKAQKANKV